MKIYLRNPETGLTADVTVLAPGFDEFAEAKASEVADATYPGWERITEEAFNKARGLDEIDFGTPPKPKDDNNNNNNKGRAGINALTQKRT